MIFMLRNMLFYKRKDQNNIHPFKTDINFIWIYIVTYLW